MLSQRAPFVLRLFGPLLLSCAVSGQEPVFLLNGVVKSRDTRQVMPGTTIVAKDTAGDQSLAYRVNTLSDKRGRYSLALQYNAVYAVEYQAQDHATKRLIVDLTNMREKDREGGDMMSLEISLFPRHRNVDYSVFDQPIAVGRFDRKLKKFAWDEEYSRERQGDLAEMDRNQEEALRTGRNQMEEPAQDPSTPMH